MREQTFRVGADGTFWWLAPAPLSAPVLTTRLPAGNVVDTLTIVHAAATVSAIAADRRTLTVGAIAAQGGIPGDRGDAYLVTIEDGWFPVIVVRAVGTTIILSTALPKAINLSSAATLQFAWWSATLAALDVTAAARRDVPWQVTYTRSDGAALPNELLVDEGILHVTRAPFDTGLRHAGLVRLRPSLASGVSKTANDYGYAIDAAGEEIGQRLDLALQERGLSRDEVPAAERLQLAHAYLAHAIIVEERDLDAAEKLRARSTELFRLAIRAIWIDVDRDGVVDTGDAAQAASGPSIDDIGNYFAGRDVEDYAEARRVFTRWSNK